MLINGVKYYVKYSMNEYINKKNLIICEVKIYIYME